MAQAIVDPEHYVNLQPCCAATTNNFESPPRHLPSHGRLSESWRDQEHNKFAEEFDEQLRQVQRWSNAPTLTYLICSRRPS